MVGIYAVLQNYIIFSGGQDSSNTADSDDKHQTYL